MIDFPHSHNPDPEWVSFVYGATATSHSKYSWFRHMLWVWDWPHSCLELDRICSSKRLCWESHACLGSSGAQLTVGGDSPGSQRSTHRPVAETSNSHGTAQPKYEISWDLNKFGSVDMFRWCVAFSDVPLNKNPLQRCLCFESFFVVLEILTVKSDYVNEVDHRFGAGIIVNTVTWCWKAFWQL